MMSNYPVGTKNDPDAPWNKDPGDDCHVCKGQGKLGEAADDGGIFYEECYWCDGTGIEPVPQPDPDAMMGGPDYEDF